MSASQSRVYSGETSRKPKHKSGEVTSSVERSAKVSSSNVSEIRNRSKGRRSPITRSPVYRRVDSGDSARESTIHTQTSCSPTPEKNKTGSKHLHQVDQSRHRKNSDRKHSHGKTPLDRTKCTQQSEKKIPYFIDPIRERERIRRVYGSSRSRSPPISSKYIAKRSRSRDRTYEKHYSKNASYLRENKRKRSPHRSRSRHRSRSPEREHLRSPRRRHHLCSRSKSRSNDRGRKRNSRDRCDDMSTKTITIQIPLSEYPLAFAPWSHPIRQPYGGVPYPPFHIAPMPIMGPVRYGMPPRAPPYPVRYNMPPMRRYPPPRS